MKYESECPDTRTCTQYSHEHCASCNRILNAVGGGGDDGNDIGGYEDEQGNGSRKCVSCSDSRLCLKCSQESSKCGFCVEFEAQPCRACQEPIGADFADLNAVNIDGQSRSVGPQYLVCRTCAALRVAV